MKLFPESPGSLSLHIRKKTDQSVNSVDPEIKKIYDILHHFSGLINKLRRDIPAHLSGLDNIRKDLDVMRVFLQNVTPDVGTTNDSTETQRVTPQ